jgi:hypothetical protein
VKSCSWQRVQQISTIQARPRDDKALYDFTGNRRERELKAIAEEILALGLRGARPGTAEPSPKKSKEASKRLRPSVPHQLPPLPSNFVGREEELAALEKAIRERAASSGVTISGVRGLGGVGKSALALMLARRLGDLLPGGEIYLDLQGASTMPLSSASVMEHAIRTFLPVQKLPSEQFQLERLYQTILIGKRTLLLFDNAASLGQIQLLVPPPGNVLLVTSRQRIQLPGLIARDLFGLPPDRSRELLLKIAPRVGADAEALATLSGHFPLALHLVGSALAVDQGLAPATLIR